MARRLADHRRIVCASPAYTKQHGTPAAPAELAAHTALRVALAPDDKWLLVKRAARAARPKEAAVQLHGRMRANDTDALLELAVAGCGIALLPAWAAGAALRAGTLVQLLPEWEARTAHADPAIWAVYPPKKTVSSKVRAFLDFYAALYADERYWQA